MENETETIAHAEAPTPVDDSYHRFKQGKSYQDISFLLQRNLAYDPFHPVS